MTVAFKQGPAPLDAPATATSGTPEQRRRVVRAAVGWLLGPELLGKLRKIFRKRSDPREWMPYYPRSLHDERWERRGALQVIVPDGKKGGAPLQNSDRAMLSSLAPGSAATQPEVDVWFDYAADMGDAVDSMYAVAYASMVSFDAPATTETWAAGRVREPIRVHRSGAGSPPALQRGTFLFVGGDTAYHVADAATLKVRVEEPFAWAFADAQHDGYIEDTAGPNIRTRRIYGIPGNHDWYDNLEGFALVFRRGSPSQSREEKRKNPIELPEFERVQLASHPAILLPFGWQLWGLDIDSPIDGRQQAYFESLAALKPERLIIATPSPGIVFGASVANDDHRGALTAIGAPHPTVPLESPATATPRYRLDLSGDVHHYARYYPRAPEDTYGSVVSGLGGAFHHPSFTRATGASGQIAPINEYPKKQQSLDSIGDKLLNWKSSWYGSWARAIPFLLALLCGMAATHSVGGRWLLDHVLSLLPGYALPEVERGAEQLSYAVLALGVLALAGGGIYAAYAFAKRVFEHHVTNPDAARNLLDVFKSTATERWYTTLYRIVSPMRSYWAVWTLAVITTAPLVLYPFWGPDSTSLRLDVATLIVIALPAGGGIAGWAVAKHVAWPRRSFVAITGVVHAAAQVTSAIAFTRFFTTHWEAALGGCAAIVVSATCLVFARPLFKKADSPLHVLFLALFAIAVFVGSMAILVVAAHRSYVIEPRWKYAMTQFIGSGIAAALFGTTLFIWYLAVAGRLDAHNNEVGGAARVTTYRQMIRFRVHRQGLTGYVIAIENVDAEAAAHAGGRNLRFYLIDVFTIAAPAPAAPTNTTNPADGRLESGLSVAAEGNA